MGILELIFGILILLFLVNLFWALIPIPRTAGGAIVLILVILLVLRLMHVI
jgi:hypothetical protein